MTHPAKRTDEEQRLDEARALPEPINRTTRRGGDQYVLGCSVRQFADDISFANIERIENDNSALRKELAWKLERGTKRNRKWVRSRMLIVAYLLVVGSAYAGWLFSSNGRVARVAFLRGYSESLSGPVSLIREEQPLLRDIPQRDIDSLVAWMATTDARRGR